MEQPQATSQELTPSAIGEAVAKSISESRNAEAQQRAESSLDIRDPSVKRDEEPKTALEKAIEQQPSASAISPKTAPATIPGAVTHSEVLLQQAAELGISEDEAKAIKPATLWGIVNRASQQFEPEPEPTQQQQQQQFAFDPYTGQPLQRQQQLPDLPRLDPEKYEPDLVQAWDAHNQFILEQRQLIEEQRAQLEQLNGTVQQQQERQTQIQNQQALRALEGMIQKDEEFKDVFGEGPAHKLVGTAAYAARHEVALMMDSIRDGYQRRGRATPDMESLYTMAKQAIHGTRAQAKVEKVTVDMARNRAGQFTGRTTTASRGELPKGPERAVAALQRAMNNGTN
jgi:hypothetical protein